MSFMKLIIIICDAKKTTRSRIIAVNVSAYYKISSSVPRAVVLLYVKTCEITKPSQSASVSEYNG